MDYKDGALYGVYKVTITWKAYTEVGCLDFCRKQAQSGPEIYGIYCLIYPSGLFSEFNFPMSSTLNQLEMQQSLVQSFVGRLFAYFLNFEKVLRQHRITVDSVFPQQ